MILYLIGCASSGTNASLWVSKENRFNCQNIYSDILNEAPFFSSGYINSQDQKRMFGVTGRGKTVF